MTSFHAKARWVGAAAALFTLMSGSAFAQSCETDIAELQKKRTAQMADLSKSAKKGDKLDPVIACPKLRALSTTESAIVAYMQKNQNWCGVPDQIVEQVKEMQEKTSGVAKQACGLAAQVKKQQQQQQAAGAGAGGGGAPGFNVGPQRLPAGPL